MNWRQAVMNWSLTTSWFEIFDFMNWIAQFHQCRRQFIVLEEIIKMLRKIGAFLCRPKVEIISSSFESTVWYREYREYANIKCCTKFAPRSHQHSTLFCSTNWNLSINWYFQTLLRLRQVRLSSRTNPMLRKNNKTLLLYL